MFYEYVIPLCSCALFLQRPLNVILPLQLQPLQVVPLESAWVLSTCKPGVGFGLYFFPQYAQLVCSGKSSLRELNGSIAQTKLCGETTWWYLFHRSTASECRVLSEMLDNWIPKCRQRVLERFFSHCIGCRIKTNVRRPLGQSWGALLLFDIYFTIWPSPQFQHFVRKTLFSFKSSEKFCLNLKRQILCRIFFPCLLKTFFLLLYKSRSH